MSVWFVPVIGFVVGLTAGWVSWHLRHRRPR